MAIGINGDFGVSFRPPDQLAEIKRIAGEIKFQIAAIARKHQPYRVEHLEMTVFGTAEMVHMGRKYMSAGEADFPIQPADKPAN